MFGTPPFDIQSYELRREQLIFGSLLYDTESPAIDWLVDWLIDWLKRLELRILFFQFMGRAKKQMRR